MPPSKASTSPPACSPSPRAKGAYDRLAEGDLTARLPFEDARFAGCVCAGVFTTGHVGAEGLDELLRVLRPGGVLVLTVKDRTWGDGFAARVDALAAKGGSPASTPRPPTARCPAAPTTPRAASWSCAASDRGKIVDAPRLIANHRVRVAKREPDDDPTHSRDDRARRGARGRARHRRGRAGLARPDPAHAARLDRPAHHHPDHGRGAGEGRPQRRVRPGRLPRPVRRPQDRRPARRHGDLGDHRPRRHGRGHRHRPGGQPRRDRHAGDRGVVVPRLHDRRPAPASPTGRRCSSPPAPRPSPPRRRCPTAATSAARSPGAASTRSASRRSSSPSR